MVSAWLAIRAGAALREAAGAATAPMTGADRKATVELLADRDAIVPGRPLTVAVRFRIEKGWHIYWRNPGTGGMRPKVTWRLPPGFEAGPLKFPAPKRESSPVGDSFVLTGRPVLLTEIRAPTDLAAGSSVEIAARVEWLVCRDLCAREAQDVSLTMPVRAPDATAEPAHEAVFRAALRELPVPSERSEYLTLTTAVSVDRLRPGDEAKLALVLSIREGHHIQSNRPLTPGLVATDVFPDDVPGLTIGDPLFPPAVEREVPGLGRVAEFSGQTIIVVPFRANPDLRGSEARISGVLTYQACEEASGQCFPAQHVEWSHAIPVAPAGAQVTQTHQELFRAVSTTGGPPAPAGWFERPIAAQTEQVRRPLWMWLILALLSGLILNVTPCVLPVISIKVLSFVQQAQESPVRVFKLGLAFAAGMMLVFNLLAILAAFLNQVWGQHFQNPDFVVAMTAIIFAFGLSLFGVFTLGVPRTIEEVAARQKREGYLGSLAKGALATALGTPCLGPLLGAVVIWAVTQPKAVVFLAFNTIGAGMALPYVILTANPRWLRFMPKPGPWMETFKHVMGFLLMATVVYLLMIVQGQRGGTGVVWTVGFLVGVAFAAWFWGRYVTLDRTAAGRAVVRLAAVGIVAVSWWVTVRGSSEPPPAIAASGARPAGDGIAWEPFSVARLEQLSGEGRTVMVDVTAEWCPNCKYNLKFVLDGERVVRKVRELEVVPLVADWTARDEEIGRFIQKLAPGASIPLLAIFPAGRPNEPIVLLGILTQEKVVRALEQAAGRGSPPA